MSRQQVTLESAVMDYLSTHDNIPEFPEDIVGDREDCYEVQADLQREIAPELQTSLQRSQQLYDTLKVLLDPAGQALLAEYWEVQASLTSDYKILAWQISAEVQRQILTTPSLN